MIGKCLAGNKVHLRAMNNDDLKRRTNWMNDAETMRFFAGVPPIREYLIGDAKRWRCDTEADPYTIIWAIESIDGRHIGDVDLHGIDYNARSAKLAILIGDKEYWNKGCGTDTIRTILRYAFTKLCLETVHLKVFNFNSRAIRCYEKCGFIRLETPFYKYGGRSCSNEVHMMVTKKSCILEDPDEYAICDRSC